MDFKRNMYYLWKGIPGGKAAPDTKFTYFDENGEQAPWSVAQCDSDEQVRLVNEAKTGLVNGVVFEKPAIMIRDDKTFNKLSLPLDKLTHLRIDKERSKHVPWAVKRYFRARNQVFFVYLLDRNGKYTTPGWVDSFKIRVITS